MKTTVVLAAGLVAAVGFALPAAAAAPHSHPHAFHPGPPPRVAPMAHVNGGFRGHDFAHFSASEHAMWSHGRWRHDWHHGHFGWWFVVDDSWFFYPEPVYPYPTYVGDYYDGSYAPPGYGYWYYCRDPEGYYPYVRECNGSWEPVPAMPPPGAQQPPPGNDDENDNDDGPDQQQ